MRVKSVFRIPNLDFDKTAEKLTRKQHGIASAFITQRGLLQLYVTVPIYRIRCKGYKWVADKKVAVQISPKKHLNIDWCETAPPKNASSWYDIAWHKARELRLALNTILGHIVTIDGKPPEVIYEQRVPPLPAELKARRCADFITYFMPILLWYSFSIERIRQRQKELKLLIKAELEKREEFSRLKRAEKQWIVNDLVSRYFWDYWSEMEKGADLFKEFKVWFGQRIRDELAKITVMPVEERYNKWLKALTAMSGPILE